MSLPFPFDIYSLFKSKSYNRCENPKAGVIMKNIEQILSTYSMTRETAAKYVDAITRSNQTQTAEELNVSRDTINRYKNAFAEMDAQERLLLISSLTQEKLLDQATE